MAQEHAKTMSETATKSGSKTARRTEPKPTAKVSTPRGGQAQRQGKLYIGTSGWTYDGWRGPFYPVEVPKKNWLIAYAGQFRTTEINGSFYRTPSLETVR